MATTAVNGAVSAHSRGTTSTASSASSAASSVAKRGLSSPPSLLNARLFARLSAGYAQEQKMAELRAAYASPLPPVTSATSTTIAAAASSQRNGPSRASLPMVASMAAPMAAGIAQLPSAAATAGLDLYMAAENGIRSGFSSNSSSRRGSAVANCLPTPSIMELAASAGLLSLSPSDLVFESSVLGIAYYDFILSVSEVTSTCANARGGAFAACGANSCSSCSSSTTIKENNSPKISSEISLLNKRKICNTGSEPTPRNSAREAEKSGPAMLFKNGLDKQRPGTSMGINNEQRKTAQQQTVELVQKTTTASTFSSCNYRLFLAKLDSHTNVEWFESVVVPGELLERNGLPINELSLLTMGILIWRSRMANSRLLCLANGQLGEDSTTALEALKRAAGKYKCMHHVLTIGQRRQSASSTHSSCSSSSYRSSSSCGSHGQSQDAGMKLRVLMCQSRSELSEVPYQAVRDAKFLMAPSQNPLLCLCFPLT